MAVGASIRQKCQTYAVKYGFKPTDCEKGLEAYAAHVFVQEDGFDALLAGATSDEADLSEFILRSDDLHVDVVLEDETHKQFILVQAMWRTKTFDEMKLNDFANVVDRLIEPSYLQKGGERVRDLLGSF